MAKKIRFIERAKQANVWKRKIGRVVKYKYMKQEVEGLITDVEYYIVGDEVVLIIDGGNRWFNQRRVTAEYAGIYYFYSEKGTLIWRLNNNV